MGRLSLEKVKELKPKEICYLTINDITWEAFEWAHDVHEINACDKCGGLEWTEELVWLSEDFEPFDEEAPNKIFYEKWGDCALCERCYLEEIKETKKHL